MVLFSAKKKKERQGFLKIVFLYFYSPFYCYLQENQFMFFFISIEDRRKALKIVVGELSIR